mmetsp:Transcript_57510/g.136822  ORF Transcript_57510/g.136822 Transcript_57510/m.136822 type:complete len:287 (-) Transcript_57510:241-1101(-)
MRFYFIRHAESQNNKRELDDVSSNAKAHEGRSPDPDLTDRGRMQAKHCALALRPLTQDATPQDHRVKWVYSSLMRRSLQTAQPIAEALGVPIRGKANIHEEGGVFAGERSESVGAEVKPADIRHGMKRAEVEELIPGIELGDDVDESGWWRGGRETEDEVFKRAADVAAWMHELAAKMEGTAGAAVVVSHGLFLARLFVALLHCQPLGSSASVPAFLSMNCSLSVLDILGGRVSVCAINSVEHLPPGTVRTGHRALGFQLAPCPPFDGSCRSNEEENGRELKKLKR